MASESSTIVQIYGQVQFLENQAVETGGVMYLGKGATTRVTEKVLFKANTAATGGCFYLEKGSQV